MSDILEKYDVKFTYDEHNNGAITLSSNVPILTRCIESYDTGRKVGRLYADIKQFLEFDKRDELDLPGIGVKKFLLTKSEATIFVDETIEDLLTENTFTLPITDLQTILNSFLKFYRDHKSREVEITNGEAVIDIINDGFVNALVIEKAVAAHWPDCGGSVGEYYSVSTHNYEKQKELTANLNQSLISGSDTKVFEAVKSFLSLFKNGKYNITISEIDLNSSEIARDGMGTYADHIKDEEKFTYWTYPSFTGLYLFTRSINTIDKNRVTEYVDLISEGARPKVVVYSKYDDFEYDETPYYIIDGHHKLLAYQQLQINIPTVFISKTEAIKPPQKNITPQLVSFLRPVEIMHILLENENTTDIEAYMTPDVTYYLDKILKENKGVGINIIKVLYDAYHSDNKTKISWVNERFVVLSKNKYRGKGLRLSYKIIDPKHNGTTFTSIFIENERDFLIWKKIFLEDGEMPADIVDRQTQISRRYYPPPLHNNNKNTTYRNSSAPKNKYSNKSFNQRFLETVLACTIMFAITIIIFPSGALIIGLILGAYIIKILIDNQRTK